MDKSKIEETVENTFSDGWRFDFMAKAFSTHWIEEHLFDRSIKYGDSVLILGVGGGRIAFSIKKRCNEVVGVDFSLNMITLANERNEDKNIKFIYNDVNKMDLKQKFDVIVAPTQFLSYIPKDKINICMKNALKHLKKGGYFIGSVFYTFGSIKRFFGNTYLYFIKNKLNKEFGEWQFEDRCRIKMYSKKQIRKLFYSHNLKYEKLIITKPSPISINELYFCFIKK